MAGDGSTTAFPGAQSDKPNLSMIPATATKIACLDYDVVAPDPPPTLNPSDPATLNPFYRQWGDYYGMCPMTTYFEANSSIRRTGSGYSAHYSVSGTCTKEDPIIGTGGVSRRAEISSHVQPTDAVEGDERWYYLALRPAAGMPTPVGNYFLVTQWHPKTNRSPALSINFHKSGTVDIGEDHKWMIGQLHKGQWTDYVLHVKFSSSPIGIKKGTGWVEAWENGVKTVCKASAGLPPQQPSQPPRCPQGAGVDPAPFAALPDKSVFIKQGIYADPSETGTQEVWHDGMTVWKPKS